ncbi:MAG: 3-phosphoserine/phosphohydroxythreonine transaminase, partial [Gammaproteobacteria bacterium]|nr:3-phosphoserine/phosphohydroxythreonine transaminase [Gammaproteobacteria bacterium]
DWDRSDDAAFLHYTPNETIGGVEFQFIPDSEVPLVADMSSTILSRPVDVARFGVIYAGAQKNIGPAGLTIVIVANELLGQARPETPSMLDYQVQANAGSMSNTPATFSWYVAGLVFAWLRQQGGLDAMAERNAAKKDSLYSVIDASDFYSNPVDPQARSWMNIPFTLANPELDPVFLEQAAGNGLANLKGHRSVGGMRASIYNAMPQSGVDALIEFMNEFERTHG